MWTQQVLLWFFFFFRLSGSKNGRHLCKKKKKWRSGNGHFCYLFFHAVSKLSLWWESFYSSYLRFIFCLFFVFISSRSRWSSAFRLSPCPTFLLLCSVQKTWKTNTVQVWIWSWSSHFGIFFSPVAMCCPCNEILQLFPGFFLCLFC